MDAKELIQRLSIEDIIQILESLDADILYEKETSEYIISSTICHHSDSHKLYLYKDSKSFYCYSKCHKMSLFDVIMKSKGITFKESLDYIYETIYSKHRPRRLVKKFKATPLNDIIIEPLPPVKKQFLYELYKDIEIEEWKNEGITYNTTKKFKIRKDDVNNRIIIPHFNIKNELIGIRVRNLRESEIDRRGKYHPLFVDGIGYAHPLGRNLYGLNISMNKINEFKKCIVFESEKAVMQYETLYPGNNVSVAICGSSFSNTHKKMLLDLGVEEICLCMDKEFIEYGDEECIEYEQKIIKQFNGLEGKCKCSYVIDTDGLLNKKDSPSDKGKKIFEKLIKQRKFIKE